MELEPVSLKSGRVERYVPVKEEMETVNLRALQLDSEKEKLKKQSSPPPDWAAGNIKLGASVGKYVIFNFFLQKKNIFKT